jgi:putative addiction module killer protein
MILYRTRSFDDWLKRLRDPTARARIQVRLDRLGLGLAGDAKPVGQGVSELRIRYGPGYRVYFTRSAADEFLILMGGTKNSQQSDIQKAIAMARDFVGGLDE